MQAIRQNGFRTVLPEIADMLGEYHQLFDIYHEYSGINNLCTVNKMAAEKL